MFDHNYSLRQRSESAKEEIKAKTFGKHQMVQGIKRNPAIYGSTAGPNSPESSLCQVNGVNLSDLDLLVRTRDMITVVWEVPPAPQARTVEVKIITPEVNKMAKLLLPTQCPKLRITLETDTFNKYLKLTIDQP